jgi:hypothetical protein
VLTGEFDDEPDVDLEIERYLSADRMAEWEAAADLVGLPLAEFVVITLDRAAAAAIQASCHTGGTPVRDSATYPARTTA